MPAAPDLPVDPDALKRLIAENQAVLSEKDALIAKQNAELEAAEAQLIAQKLELEKLRFQVAYLKRQKYGRSSEQMDRELVQMQLSIEDLETSLSSKLAEGRPPALEAAAAAKPSRRPLPAALPRDEQVLNPPCSCPACGGELRAMGEDISEILERVPARYKVIRIVRPKLSCTDCQKIVQQPAPSRPIERGLVGPGMLAHVLVSKYCDHLPLYRQSRMLARDQIDLDRSTLADWVGGASRLLQPLVDAIGRYVLNNPKIHADDTPVPVLCPGRGTTKQGRLWTYVRDDRPAGSVDAPAVWFRYTPDRKGERPRAHLATFTGVLQADAYAGFDRLYGERIQEAACWAHVRRKFYDIHVAVDSPMAAQALDRIGRLYAVEAEIRGRLPNDRVAVRQARAGPELTELRAWLERSLTGLPRKGELTLAIRYALSNWIALTRYRDDGRLEIDNNAAERALRTVALGRKNWLFAGSDEGGERAAAIYSILGTASLNGLNPEGYLQHVLAHIPEHPINRIDELLPWNVATKLPELHIAA